LQDDGETEPTKFDMKLVKDGVAVKGRSGQYQANTACPGFPLQI
jgi:hypothetical protein